MHTKPFMKINKKRFRITKPKSFFNKYIIFSHNNNGEAYDYKTRICISIKNT